MTGREKHSCWKKHTHQSDDCSFNWHASYRSVHLFLSFVSAMSLSHRFLVLVYFSCSPSLSWSCCGTSFLGRLSPIWAGFSPVSSRNISRFLPVRLAISRATVFATSTTTSLLLLDKRLFTNLTKRANTLPMRYVWQPRGTSQTSFTQVDQHRTSIDQHRTSIVQSSGHPQSSGHSIAP